MEPSPTPQADDSRMPDQSRMEALSRAYIQALIAQAGINYSVPQKDFGTDMYLSKIEERDGNRYTDTLDRPVPVQIKATTRWEIRDVHIVYDLEAKTYNDLVRSRDCVLILMCLPPDANEWLDLDEDHLQIRKCCYYWRPTDRTRTPNTQTQRIFIPRNQLLTVDALTRLVNEEAQ